MIKTTIPHTLSGTENRATSRIDYQTQLTAMNENLATSIDRARTYSLMWNNRHYMSEIDGTLFTIFSKLI